MLTGANFDESTIDWKSLPDPEGEPVDHVSLSILNVDDRAKIVDVLFKFSANEKILMHRHTSTYTTFTVQGELCLLYTSPSPRDQRGSRMPSSA